MQTVVSDKNLKRLVAMRDVCVTRDQSRKAYRAVAEHKLLQYKTGKRLSQTIRFPITKINQLLISLVPLFLFLISYSV